MTVRVRRTGFTLIELLVVIFIITVIATLVVMAIPKLDQNKGVPNATNEIAGWIRVSRMTALKDNNPTGVRLVVDPTDGRVRSLQYITQPPALAPRGDNIRLRITTPTPGQSRAELVRLNGMNPPVPLPWENVFAGDFLELTDSPRVVARITAVGGSQLALDRQIESIETPADLPPTGTELLLATGFRVHRAPQPLVGEPALTFNSDCLINLDPTMSFLPPMDAGGGINILFNTNGAVANAPYGLYVLGVQHQDKPIQRLLIGISTRTGKITTAPYDDAGIDPFSYLKDGRSPGL